MYTTNGISVSEFPFSRVSNDGAFQAAPYIPPIDPLNDGDTQDFDETFLDMDSAVEDAEDDEEQTDTDTDCTDGEGSVVTPSRSRSPSVHVQEAEVDVFDGCSFKGRHSAATDDDGENSDLCDEDDEYDEEEEASIPKNPASKNAKDQAMETETEEERKVSPEEMESNVEPAQPARGTEPPDPTKRSPGEILRPSVDSQRSEISSKSGKPPIPPKSSNVPQPLKRKGKRREKSGIAAFDKDIGDGVRELTVWSTSLDSLPHAKFTTNTLTNVANPVKVPRTSLDAVQERRASHQISGMSDCHKL